MVRLEQGKVRTFGSFAESALLVLVSLRDGPKDGCGIVTDIEAGTGRPMGPGTLYAAIARLETARLVEPLAPIDRRRRYRITALGEATLDQHVASHGAIRASVQTQLVRWRA